MFKSIFRKSTSILLILCMIVSIASVGTITANAGVGTFFAEKAAEKLLEIGMRSISTGLGYLSEATGSEDQDYKPFSLINDWIFKSPEECALDELYELCEEILKEIKEIDTKMTESFAFVESYMAESEVNSAKKIVNDEWDNDVDGVIRSYNATAAFNAYQKYLTDAVNRESEETLQSDLENLFYKFFDMYPGSVSPGDYNLDTIKETMFTTTEMNSRFTNMITELSEGLVYEDMNTGSVALYAAQFANKYYPFSHQQYQYLHAIMEKQIITVMMVEMMYNEYLFHQGEYFEANPGEDNKDYNGYLTLQRQFDKLMTDGDYSVDARISEMLEKKMVVDNTGSVQLTLNDYMKPEDAALTTLTINGYADEFDAFNAFRKANNCEDYLHESYCANGTNKSKAKYINSTINFNKVMTHTSSGSRVFYIIDPEQYRGTDALYVTNMCHKIDITGLSDWHTESCDFNNLCKPMTDGVNTYSIVSDEACTGLQELFRTNYFTLRDSKPQNYLSGYYDYLPTFGDSGTNPEASRNFIPSSHYKYTYKSIGTDWTHFYVIDGNEQFTGGEVKSDFDMYSEDWEGKKTASYSIILKNDDTAYKHNLTAALGGSGSGQIRIYTEEDDETCLEAGSTTQAQSGKMLTIKMKSSGVLPESLTVTRSNIESSTEILLETEDFEQLTVDSEGWYEFSYPMPYSDAVFTLNTPYTATIGTVSHGTGSFSQEEDVQSIQAKPGDTIHVYFTGDPYYHTFESPTVTDTSTGQELSVEDDVTGEMTTGLPCPHAPLPYRPPFWARME